MKRLVLSAALLFGASAPLSLAFAHGGQYRGPGDTVPPGGGGGGGGSPAPSGPTGPAGPNGGPSTPGPAGPGTPGMSSGGPGSPISGPADVGGVDLSAWQFWWEFNKEPFLNLKAAIHSGGARSGSDDFFMTRDKTGTGKDAYRPSDEQVRNTIVPALLKALETESNNDIITGCLIALAKIGDLAGEDGSSKFEAAIQKQLTSSNQEIAETAAVALGILARESSVGPLSELMADSPEGRKLVGSSEVHFRTRAFAAYGLGLIGARTSREDLRQQITKSLTYQIDNDNTSSRDLQVACLISLGQVPLTTIEPAVAPGTDEVIDPSSCLVGQIEYALRFLRNTENRYLVRAHAPTTLARLMLGLPAERYQEYKKVVAEELLALTDKRSKAEKEIMQSSVLALGLLGDLDADPIDTSIRKALDAAQKEQSDLLTKNFALIALGKLAFDPTSDRSRGKLGGDKVEEGIAEVSKSLLGQLSKGNQSTQAWAALGIAVFGHAMNEANYSSPLLAEMSAALRSSLKDAKTPTLVGAYSISAGILRDPDAVEILLDKLDTTSDDEARGYVAVGLGLIQNLAAEEKITQVVTDSKYKPELLKQAAIGLGLLGDKDIVPVLLEQLKESKALAAQAAVSSALGFIGDTRSVDPLIAMLQNKDLTELARGFAAVALGIVADKEPLPWNSKIAVDLNYTAATNTLNDQTGTGILNIL